MTTANATLDTVDNAIVLEILDSDIRLPTLPGVGARLLELSQDSIDDIDIGEIAGLIEGDPGLYAKILQLANSSFYGTLNKITSVRQAIMHIGLDETLYSVLWLFYKNILPKFPAIEDFDAHGYWTHAWSCAVANKMLGHPDLRVESLPGDLYLAGLFHGIGKVILALHKPADFQQCIQNARDYDLTLAESEQDIFGTTDTLIASQVMQSWKFPINVCYAVEFYRDPGAAPREYQEIAALTQFAYYLANTSGLGNSGDEFCYDLNDTFIAKNTDSPLADATMNKKVAQRIYTALFKKASSVTGAELPESPQPAEMESPKPAAKKQDSDSFAARGKKLCLWLCSLWKHT